MALLYSETFEAYPLGTFTSNLSGHLFASNQSFTPSRITVVTSPVRVGSRGLRVECRDGDINVAGSGNGERAELCCGQFGLTDAVADGLVRWFNVSVRFDTSFTPSAATNWNDFIQIHGNGSTTLGQTGQAPFQFAVDSNGVDLCCKCYGGTSASANSAVYKLVRNFQRNVWYDIVFGVNFADDSTGWVEFWVNGVQVLARTNRPTRYTATGGYLKIGNYRNGSNTSTSVTYFDQVLIGSTMADVAIGGSSGVAPANTMPPVVSGVAAQGSTLSASSGTWTGSPTPSIAYQWQQSADSGVTWADIAGETAATLELTSSYLGSLIRVAVTGANTAGFATATSNQVGPIASASLLPFDGPTSPIRDFLLAAGDGGYPASDIFDFDLAGDVPDELVAPVVSGTPTNGQTLACSTGVWDNPATYTYQWQRDSLANNVYADIAAATSSSYVLVGADVGCHVRCVVTATNGNGSTAAASNSLLISDVAPINTVAPTVTGTTAVGQILTSTSGVWTTSGPISYAYQWQRSPNGSTGWAAIAAAVGPSYLLAAGDATYYLRCIVTATNSGGSASATSNSVGPTAAISVSVTLPTIYVQAAFGSQPGDAVYQWTDITPYVRSIRYGRGKQQQLNTIEAGVATIVLRDETRVFDPTNTASPFYPYVKPLVPIRAYAATQTDTTFPLFQQYVERWPLRRIGPSYAERELSTVDGFEIANQASLNPAYASLTTAFGGDNDLTFTAVQPGAAGQDITIRYDAHSSPRIAVVVADNAITVRVDTTTNTAVQVRDAIQHSSEASALVKAEVARVGVAGGFPVTSVLDNANRANGPAGANWLTDHLVISSNHFASSSTWADGMWVADEFGNDHEAYMKVIGTPVAEYWLTVRAQSQPRPWFLFYIAEFYSSGVIEINLYSGINQLANIGTFNTGVPPATNDVLGFRVVGNTLTVWKNGVLQGTATDDSVVVGGGIGLGFENGGQVDDFGGGALSVTGSGVVPSMAATNLTGGDTYDFPAEPSGTRIGRYLDIVGTPLALRLLDGGASNIAAVQLSQSGANSILALLLAAADIEGEQGFLFIDGHGRWRFIDRHSLLLSPYDTPVAVFSDTPGGGEYAYQNIVPNYDIDRILNEWTGSINNGDQIDVKDDESIGSYLRRSRSVNSSLADNDDLRASLEWGLIQYADPRYRIDSVTVMPGNNTSLWELLFSIDIGDVVTVKEHLPGGGAAIENDYRVQALDVNFNPGPPNSATFTFSLWPVEVGNWFIIGDPTRGLLSAGNRLAF